MLGGLNVPAIIVSAIVSFGLSFVWFTILFRAAYIAGLGRTQVQLDAGPSMAIASASQFAGFLVMAAGLAWLMQRSGLTSVGEGLLLALVIWAAFVAAIIGPMYAYQAFPLSFFAIVAGGYLVAMLATSVILGAWR